METHMLYIGTKFSVLFSKYSPKLLCPFAFLLRYVFSSLSLLLLLHHLPGSSLTRQIVPMEINFLHVWEDSCRDNSQRPSRQCLEYLHLSPLRSFILWPFFTQVTRSIYTRICVRVFFANSNSNILCFSSFYSYTNSYFCLYRISFTMMPFHFLVRRTRSHEENSGKVDRILCS